jgi:hypothetical protein
MCYVFFFKVFFLFVNKYFISKMVFVLLIRFEQSCFFASENVLKSYCLTMEMVPEVCNGSSSPPQILKLE